MDDKTFTEMGLKLSICPTQHRWPNPAVEFSTQGDVITAKGLHWSRSHDAANWLRNYAANVLDDIAAIDADKRLSPIGRAERKKQLAAKAKATIEKSKAIGQAKDTSDRQLAKWAKEFDSHLKFATTPHAAASVCQAVGPLS
jgi:hypothetical protein